MRWIYLSPHFDDAVLSCGGLIHAQAQQGLTVEIWTLFGGEPPAGPLSDFARQIHDLWGTGDGPQTVALRKEEDLAAAARLGAETVHFDFLDCIYRRAPDGAPLYSQSVFVAPHPLDAGLPERLAAALASELLAEDALVCPLALGGHVDHLLARAAVERLGRPLRYYADIPYLVNYPESLPAASAGLERECFPLTEADLRAWQEAAAAYASQIGSLLKVEASLAQVLQDYWREQGGLCLWRPGRRAG
ncbi:MAG: PIG-L family deacetylase [Anaerolineales bacterium]